MEILRERGKKAEGNFCGRAKNKLRKPKWQLRGGCEGLGSRTGECLVLGQGTSPVCVAQ